MLRGTRSEAVSKDPRADLHGHPPEAEVEKHLVLAKAQAAKADLSKVDAAKNPTGALTLIVRSRVNV